MFPLYSGTYGGKASLMIILHAIPMAEAYILINCELGSEDNVIKELKAISGVSEVKGVFGVYDIIARVNASNDEDLKKAVGKIRGHHGIKSSLTMMVIEGQGT